MQFQGYKTGYFQTQDRIMPGYTFTEEEIDQMGKINPDAPKEDPAFAQGGFIVFVLIICYMVSKVA